MEDIFKIFCGETIDQEIVQIIKDKLLLKYNEEFEVYKIGRRYGATSSNDTVTTYCRNIDNKDLLFTCILNADKVHFEDDYNIRLLCHELKKEILEEFKKENIEVFPRIDAIKYQSLDKTIQLKDFIEKQPNAMFFIELYIKDKDRKQDIQKIMKSFKEKYPSMNMCGNIIVVTPENYEKYTNIFTEMPDNEDYYVDQNDIIEKDRIEGV